MAKSHISTELFRRPSHSMNLPMLPSTSPESTPPLGALPLANRRHEQFCDEYVENGRNRNAACRAVGYKERNGKELWLRPEIHARIEFLSQEREKHSRLKAQLVRDQTATIVGASVDHYRVTPQGDVEPTEDAPPNAMAAIASIKRKFKRHRDNSTTVEVELKLWDKNAALNLGARILGMIVDGPTVQLPAGTGVLLVPMAPGADAWAATAADQQRALVSRPPTAAKPLVS